MSEDKYWSKEIIVPCAGKGLRTRIGFQENLLFITQPKNGRIYLYDKEFADKFLGSNKPFKVNACKNLSEAELMEAIGVKSLSQFQMMVKHIKILKHEFVYVSSSSDENTVLALPLVKGIAYASYNDTDDYMVLIRFLAQRNSLNGRIDIVFLG